MGSYYITGQALESFVAAHAEDKQARMDILLGRESFLDPLDGHLVILKEWDHTRDRYVGEVLAWAA